MAQQQAGPARAALESILARDPSDLRARLLLCTIHAAGDRPRAAAEQVRLAAENPPDDAELLRMLAGEAIGVGEIVLARRLLGQPALATSRAPALLTTVAVQWQLMADNRAALAALEQARRAGADDVAFHFQRGIQLGFNGDLTGAEREFERCTGFDPPPGYAFLQLAATRTQTAERNHLAAIDAALAAAAPDGKDAAAMQFARYKELEDLQRYDEAWAALQRGNRLVHARAPWDSAREAAIFDRLTGICTAGFLGATAPVSNAGPQPIFVVGMTRSGTTVLERLLGNHSQVESAGELAAFAQALTQALDHWIPSSIPDETALSRLPGVDWALVARHYLAQSQWRARGKPCYVDKLPRNWAWAGLIHKALPEARIINVVRDPMDVCFSNWRAYLGDDPGYGYAYDLECLAAHHHQYRRVLAHWRRAMPGVILDVDYGRLVRDPEAVVTQVLAFCGLAYEPGCTDLTGNDAPSATLSMTQVRQPIHTRSFGEWRPYAGHLAGLSSALVKGPRGA